MTMSWLTQIGVCAQQPQIENAINKKSMKDVLNVLIDSYVEAKTQNLELSTEAALLSLNSFYMAQAKTAEQKKEFLQIIFDRLKEYQRNQKDIESLAVIEVYKNFAENDDARLPLLYYVRGEINALVLKDTSALKESIMELEALDAQKFPKKQEYVDKLQGFLKDIQEYVPVLQRLGDDVWVSISGYPNINGGYPSFYITCSATNNFIPKLWVNKFNHDFQDEGINGAYVAQTQMELGDNSAYLNWSNEKLDVPSEASIVLKNQLAAGAGDLTSNLVSAALGSSSSSSLIGNAVTGILGLLMTEEPIKTICIWEATIHKLNGYMMQAKLKEQIITITPSKGEEKKVENYNVLFLRLSPQMVKAYDENLIMPSKFKKLSDKQLKKMINSAAGGKEYGLKSWNELQLAKLYDACEKQVLADGENLDGISAYNDIGIYGVSIDEIPDYNKKYPKLKIKLPDIIKNQPGFKGVYIKSADGGVAGLYGLKDKDVLLSIDGHEMSSNSDIRDYIQSLERFSPIDIQVLRGKKTIDIHIPNIGLQASWIPGFKK